MKFCTFLGYASGMLPTLFDQVYDVYKIDTFDIALNMKIEKKPELPLFKYNYTIYPIGKMPKKTDILLFGTSGPKNKFRLFQFFNFKHDIQKSDFSRLAHPTAYIARSSIDSVDSGVIIEQKVVIESQTKIGFGVNVKLSGLKPGASQRSCV